MGLFESAVSLGAGFIGQEFNRGQSSINRDFQRMMSNKAHQREVKDLRKAGLNPILSAFGKGASTPPGASATAPDHGKNFASGLQAGTAARMAKANIANTNAIASSNAVKASMDKRVLDYLDGLPKGMQSLAMSAFLSDRIGVRPEVGAVLFGSASGAEAAKKSGWLDKFKSLMNQKGFPDVNIRNRYNPSNTNRQRQTNKPKTVDRSKTTTTKNRGVIRQRKDRMSGWIDGIQKY